MTRKPRLTPPNRPIHTEFGKPNDSGSAVFKAKARPALNALGGLLHGQSALKAPCSAHAEVDHDGARLALLVSHADALTVALRELRQKRQRVVVVGKTHGFAGLQSIQRTKNRCVAKALGHTAGIEGVDGFRQWMQLRL